MDEVAKQSLRRVVKNHSLAGTVLPTEYRVLCEEAGIETAYSAPAKKKAAAKRKAPAKKRK